MILPDLIARLESAPGPSRELDWDIALAVGAVTRQESAGRTWFSLPGGNAFLGVSKGQPGQFGLKSQDGHRYTSSLDDALTLLSIDSKDHMAFGRHAYPVPEERRYFMVAPKLSGTGSSIPLAICSAALKARQSNED